MQSLNMPSIFAASRTHREFVTRLQRVAAWVAMVATLGSTESRLSADSATGPAAAGILDVQPGSGLLAFGPSGGPFNGSNRVYILSNLGSAPLEWTASITSCPLPQGLVGWWPLDGDGSDSAGRNDGIISPGTQFAPGLVGKALKFNSTTDLFSVAPSPTLDVGQGVGLTLEAWIRPDRTSGQEPIFEWGNGTVGGTGVHLWHSVKGGGNLYANLIDTKQSTREFRSAAGAVAPGVWNHVALTYNRITGAAALYVNGTLLTQVNLGSFTPQTSTTLYLGQRNVAGYPIVEFHGLIDEPSVFDHALTSAEVLGIYQAGALGKCQTHAWTRLSASHGTLFPGGFTTVDVQLNGKAALLSPGGYLDGLSFVNQTSGQGGGVLPLTLQVINRAPTLDPISAVEVPQNTSQQLVALSGISAGGSESQALLVTAVSDNPLLVPNPIEVSYSSPSSDGVLRLQLVSGVVASAKITVTVQDVGGTSLGGIDTFTRDFVVKVTPGGGTPDGTLEVQPLDGLLSSGYSTGPFQPLKKTFVVHNAGSTPVSWQAAPTGCSLMAGLVAWWPLDGDGSDIIGGNNLTLAQNVAFLPGEVNQALGFPGVTPTAVAPASPSLNVGLESGFTLETWINPSSVGSQQPIFEYSNGTVVGTGVHFWHSVVGAGSLYLNLFDTTGNAHMVSTPPGVISQKTWSHIAATYTKEDGTVSIYVNGGLITSQVIGSVTPQTSYSLYLGQRVDLGYPALSFQGAMDEPAVYKRALLPVEILEIYVAGAAGRCPGASWASAVPSYGILAAGSSATFDLRLNGKALLLDPGLHLTTFGVSSVGSTNTPALIPAIIQVINRTPTIDPTASFQILEGSGAQVIYLSGIAAGGVERQTLFVTATSDNPDVILNPIEIVYTSPSPTGILRLNPKAGAAGAAKITVVVADSGGSSLGAIDSVTNHFSITILPRIESITMHAIPDQVLMAGDVMVVVPEVSLLNVLQENVGYELSPETPSGVLLNAPTGALIWNTTDVAPRVYSITISAFDKLAPQIRDSRTFKVVIRGRPVLTALQSDGVLLLRWTSVAGHAYKLMTRETLGDSPWVDLPTEYLATGNVTTAMLPLKTSARAFYQIVLAR